MSRWAPWALAAAALVVCGWLAYRLNAGSEAQAELEHERQESAAAAAGLEVERDVSRADAEKLAEQLAEREAAFAAALADAREHLPKARVTEVLHGETAPLTCASTHADAPPTDTVPLSRVVLTTDQHPVLAVDSAVLTGSAGARVVAGSLSARLVGPPDVVIASGPYSVQPTEAATTEPQPVLARWGVGPAVMGGHGWAVGLAASSPPLSLLGVGFEVTGAAALGASGVEGLAAVVVRP